MNAKDKKDIEELLQSAKEVSGKKMQLIVHLPSKDAMAHARAFIKGKRGYKNIKLVTTQPVLK